MKETEKSKRSDEARRVIGNLGGPSAVAEFCNRTPSTITYWLQNGIPDGWRRYLQCAKAHAFELPKPSRKSAATHNKDKQEAV